VFLRNLRATFGTAWTAPITLIHAEKYVLLIIRCVAHRKMSYSKPK